MTGYDVIGDVHGCYDSLIELLTQLGYEKSSGVYRHSNRQVIFVGDLVDRGPKIRETLHLVHDMVERGHAQMVLGNHELSTIRYLTKARPGSGKQYLREHTERNNHQIRDTLRQFQHHGNELQQFAQWFYSVPLFLEMEHFRVVHACWDQRFINAFKARYGGAMIDENMMHEPLESLARQTIERLTRGTNMRLPGGEKILGCDGYTRRFFRAKFWHENPEVYGDLVFQPDPLPEHIHHQPLSNQEREQLVNYGNHERPLFIGHYWCVGVPEPLKHNVACLDYSAINGGELVAYRMGRENVFDARNFIRVKARESEMNYQTRGKEGTAND